jgi:acid phosphatase (class A)
MTNIFKNCLLGVVFFVLAGCCQPHTHYTATGHIVLSDVLPPPPETGSPAEKADLDAVLQAQKTRSKAQIISARQDTELNVFRFQSVLGEHFTAVQLPVTTEFFEHVSQDENVVIQKAKWHYNRPRPFTASKLVKPVIPPLANPSYPSGHSSFAYMNAILLARMVPVKTTELFKRADIYAQNRVIAGVHYPTDIKAGKTSARVIVDAWSHDKQFITEFTQAKNELRHKLQLPVRPKPE